MLHHPNFDPVAVQLGPLKVHWYGLMYLLAFAAAWWLARLRARRPGAPLSPEQVEDLIFWGAIGVVVGGRLGYVLFYGFDHLVADPTWLLRVWEGGMAFHGGLLGVIAVMWWFARRHGQHIGDIFDFVAPIVPLGLGFGRIGNFIGQELWGRPTDLPWGIVFCNRTIEATYGSCPAGGYSRHPSQLYEAALEGLFLFFLLRWSTHVAKKLPRPGFTTGLFLLGYGVVRMLLETVREPDAQMPEALRGMITMGLLLSIPMVLIGGWLIWRSKPKGSAA